MYDLEKRGGSIVAGVLKMMQDKKANPPPPRDERLPPKPAGQTVGSFRRGLTQLPEAIAANLSANIRWGRRMIFADSCNCGLRRVCPRASGLPPLWQAQPDCCSATAGGILTWVSAVIDGSTNALCAGRGGSCRRSSARVTARASTSSTRRPRAAAR